MTNEIVANPGKETSRIQWALAGLSLAMLMPSLDTSIANAGLPALAEAFDASFQQVQWIVLSYLLIVTALIVGMGRLGDIVGRKRLLLVGIALFTTASLICGLAPVLWLLIAARAMQGVGAAIMLALTLAMVGEAVPKARVGSAMGLLGTMSAIGTTFAPSLGGILISSVGWGSIFLINVPLGILNFLLVYNHLPADRRAARAEGDTFDKSGTLLLAVTLAFYAVAMTAGHGRFGLSNALLLGIAVLSGVLFLHVEKNAKSPLFRISLFQNHVLSAGLVLSMLVSTIMMATLVVGPFYLSRALGLNPALVGILLSCGPLAAALMGVPAGRLVDRFGAQTIAISGLVGLAIGTVLLSVIPASAGIPGYVVPIVLVTSSYAMFQAANNTSIMSNIRSDQRGVISGMLSVSRNLGLVTGASAMGTVFAIASGTVDVGSADPQAVARGMHVTFAIASLLMVVALFVEIVKRRQPDQAVTNSLSE